jgi:diguanylate cyclase (GGDEF)-like protein
LFLQLDSELARGRRTEQPLTVIVLDLDGLKLINDRFGHLEGNKVLKSVAAGLKTYCREYDYVARMGGDEFVVLLPGLKPGDAAIRIEELRDVIRKSGSDLFTEGPLSASIGVAHFPKDGSDAEQMLAEADKRMYLEKRSRKNNRATQPKKTWAAEWTATSVQ